MKTWIFIGLICMRSLAFGGEKNASPRIQELFLDQSMPQKIYLVPGLASSIQMPCEIDEVVTPSSGILKNLSERNKNRFSLEITGDARPTNFIVHCIYTTYVFDIVVNNKTHNDFIKIVGDYGKPRLTKAPPKVESPLIHFTKNKDDGFKGINQEGQIVELENYKKFEEEKEYSDLTSKKNKNPSDEDPNFDYSSLKKKHSYGGEK